MACINTLAGCDGTVNNYCANIGASGGKRQQNFADLSGQLISHQHPLASYNQFTVDTRFASKAFS